MSTPAKAVCTNCEHLAMPKGLAPLAARMAGAQMRSQYVCTAHPPLLDTPEKVDYVTGKVTPQTTLYSPCAEFNDQGDCPKFKQVSRE